MRQVIQNLGVLIQLICYFKLIIILSFIILYIVNSKMVKGNNQLGSHLKVREATQVFIYAYSNRNICIS